MTVIVYRQVAFEHLGYLEPILAQHSVKALLEDSNSPPLSKEQVFKSSGVIVLGGPMSANDDTPFLRQQLRSLELALTSNTPVLGICLGAQLLAKAAGAPVYKNANKEIGFFDITLTKDGQHDAVLGNLNQRETVFHWHSDTFDLPQGATRLATSLSTENQAFRISPSAYGLQFHPEVSPAMIRQWCLEDANCGDMAEIENPFDPSTNAERLENVAASIFRSWIRLALDRAQCES